MNKKSAKVYIIGAGLAGLSAAIPLLKRGYRVEIYESTSAAGGRCRSFYDKNLGCEIDNGNHLLIGANKHAISLIEKLEIEGNFYRNTDSTFRFNDLDNNNKYLFGQGSLNIPNVKIKDCIQAFIKILFAPKNRNIFDILSENPLYPSLIEPFSVSVFNTACSQTPAQELRKILFKLILAGKSGLNTYIPKKSWQNALINPMVEHIETKGGIVHFSQPLKKILFKGAQLSSLELSNSNIKLASDDSVILAIPAQNSAKFLPEIAFPDKFEPIVNVHFLHENNRVGEFEGAINSSVEWVFFKEGIISTTTSAARDLVHLTNKEIADIIWRNLRKIIDLPEALPKYRVIKEKRATFSCDSKNLAKRPSAKTQYSNLFLAGDYTATGLPATIEGALISGGRAALKVV